MLSDIPTQLWPVDQVLQSLGGFVPSKMTREEVLMEVLQKLHPEAGRYVKLVYGLVWECENMTDKVLNYAEWGIWIDDNFSLFHNLSIQSLVLRVFLLHFHTASVKMGISFDGIKEAVMIVAEMDMEGWSPAGARERASGTVLYFPFLYSRVKVNSWSLSAHLMSWVLDLVVLNTHRRKAWSTLKSRPHSQATLSWHPWIWTFTYFDVGAVDHSQTLWHAMSMMEAYNQILGRGLHKRQLNVFWTKKAYNNGHSLSWHGKCVSSLS